MTKLSATILLSLSLMLLAGCSSDPKQPTQFYGEQESSKVEKCVLVACPLPGLPQPRNNEDWTKNQRILEDALTYCAVQVLECIKTQSVKPSPLK